MLTAEKVLTKEIEPRENLIEPWLPVQVLAMIYRWRESGKTWLSLAVAFAVAGGSKLMKWEVSKPLGVLFVDGELPLSFLKKIGFIKWLQGTIHSGLEQH